MEFPTKMKESWETPIYALCYSQTCPNCQGLPSKFKFMRKAVESHNDVLFTAIDVANSTACRKFGAKRLPFFIFARGSKPKYWLYPNFRCPLRWIEFVKDWANPTAKETTLEEFRGSLDSTKNGGSAFFLEVDSEDSQGVEQFVNLSTYYHVMNATFGYRKIAGTVTKMTVFKSSECTRVYNENVDIADVIAREKFSHFHLFDQPEAEEERKHGKFVILSNDGELNGTRQDILNSLSSEFCSDTSIGWARISAKLSSKDALAGSVGRAPPRFTVTDPSKKCEFEEVNIDADFAKIKSFVESSFTKGCVVEQATTDSIVLTEMHVKRTERHFVSFGLGIAVIVALSVVMYYLLTRQVSKIE